MPKKKPNPNQMELSFSGTPAKKQRKHPIGILKARLVKWSFIRRDRIESENYQSHVAHLHKLYGKPTNKNIKTYIQKVKSEASQEERIANGFSSSNDKEMQSTHHEMSSHYTRYARALEVAAKNSKQKR